MVKNFEEFINEDSNAVYYEWMDPYSGVRHRTKCKVIGPVPSGKRIEIELLEFGKNNTPPHTKMKVMAKNLIGYTPEKEVDTSWHKHTYWE